MTWNYLDIILIIPLLIAAYKGFSKGFIIEIAKLIALLVGVYGAMRFSHRVGAYLQTNLGWQSEHMGLISFAITFLLLVLIIHFIAKLLDKLADSIALGFVNNLAGSLFRVLKIGFILSVILFLINSFDKNEYLIASETKDNSILYRPVSKIAPSVFPYLNLQLLKEKTDAILPTDSIPPATTNTP